MTDAERAELRKRMEKAQSAPIRFPIWADPATVLSLLDSLDAAVAERDKLRAELDRLKQSINSFVGIPVSDWIQDRP